MSAITAFQLQDRGTRWGMERQPEGWWAEIDLAVVADHTDGGARISLLVEGNVRLLKILFSCTLHS